MRKKMTKSDLFGGLFLSSREIKGMFASIFLNFQTVSFYLKGVDKGGARGA